MHPGTSQLKVKILPFYIHLLLHEFSTQYLIPAVQEVVLPKAAGARALFTNKYGEDVKVYTVGRDVHNDWFSKEVCGGPHVQHTAQIGDFKIQKEQSSSAGVRRIRAVISGGLPLDK